MRWSWLFGWLMVLVASAHAAHGATFYVDASKTDASGCGTTAAAACRTYRYWYTSGCDANGCGNNVVAGDTVRFAAGTYVGDGNGGYLGIPFDGTASAPVTLACGGAAGSCIIDGQGVTAINYCALVGIGLIPGTPYCGADSATYVVLDGFTIRRPPAGMNAVGVLAAGTHHVVIKNCTVDGTGANSNLIAAATASVHHVTLLGNTVTNCPNSSSGCTWFDSNTNIAVVGNAFGPVSTAGNNDCNTFVSVNTGLVDGNTCRDAEDGFDEGMNSTTKLDRVIVRYNRVYGTNGSRAFPMSGNIGDGVGGSVADTTGMNVLYKNVAQATGGRCFELYGGVDKAGVFYNTCFANPTAAWGDALWLDAKYGNWLQNVRTGFNVFDSVSTQSNPLIVLDTGTTTINACPAGAPCPLIKNGIWMSERGTAGACIYWDPSDATPRSYTCGNLAQFNTDVAQQSGNFRANPMFADRSQPNTLASLRLTAASSGYLDAGDSFCRTTAAGSGNTVTVSCQSPLSDARYFFPDPTAFYGLANDDCRGRGTRASDGVSSGCYEVQVEGGCGVRAITAVTATTITLAGAACSWNANAMVHVPWAGSAPDLGALELANSGTAPSAPTLISVEPLP